MDKKTDTIVRKLVIERRAGNIRSVITMDQKAVNGFKWDKRYNPHELLHVGSVEGLMLYEFPEWSIVKIN